jgi:hypothetical protein
MVATAVLEGLLYLYNVHKIIHRGESSHFRMDEFLFLAPRAFLLSCGSRIASVPCPTSLAFILSLIFNLKPIFPFSLFPRIQITDSLTHRPSSPFCLDGTLTLTLPPPPPQTSNPRTSSATPRATSSSVILAYREN